MVNIQASPGLTHASGLALPSNYPEALRYPLEDAGQSQESHLYDERKLNHPHAVPDPHRPSET